MRILLLIPLLLWGVPNPVGRPSKAPFISGDAFRFYSDYCYDEVDHSLDPAQIKPRSTLFVKSDYLASFFSELHPKIEVPYILITHNSDDSTPGPFASYLEDEKIIAWFGQNHDGYSHLKMHPIPMGIANFCWEHGNADLIERIQQQKMAKVHLAHMQFTVETFPEERWGVKRKFLAASYCYKPPKKNFHLYMADLASSKFEIAPRGHAYDTHRIWESIYVGTIPIVKTSPLDRLYEGLPILIVENWDRVNESFLQEKYKELSLTSFNLEKMSMNYWMELIDGYKNLPP